jgi:hypothetical protein
MSLRFSIRVIQLLIQIIAALICFYNLEKSPNRMIDFKRKQTQRHLAFPFLANRPLVEKPGPILLQGSGMKYLNMHTCFPWKILHLLEEEETENGTSSQFFHFSSGSTTS